MPRATPFDEAYAHSRPRLLLQLYAYCGDPDAAADALDEAYIAASQRWLRLRRLSRPIAWTRDRAIARLDRRPRWVQSQVEPGSAATTRENARLLAALAGLDRPSRRLIVVRRLDDVSLERAAREVGLSESVAEQLIARGTSLLRAAGIDTTPAGLRGALVALSDDLRDCAVPEAAALRRAGTRRRYAATTAIAAGVAVVAVAAGAVTATHPLATAPAVPEHTPTGPTQTLPRIAPHLGPRALLTATEIPADANGGAWHPVRLRVQAGSSVYGGCVRAGDNPPPNSVWLRGFAAPAADRAGSLRQVLQLAPSDAEAARAMQQVVRGFALCSGAQLVQYAGVGRLGEQAVLIRLRRPTSAGAVGETVILARSARGVTFVSAVSAPGKAVSLSTRALLTVASRAVAAMCARTGGGCAFPPFRLHAPAPPRDRSSGRFLSTVDLPLVPRVPKAWAAAPQHVTSHNPSATVCDRADFRPSGSGLVRTRSYVIADYPRLPLLFGVSETLAAFPSAGDARAFTTTIATRIAGCASREKTATVAASTSFSTAYGTAHVWLIRLRESRTRTLEFRVALLLHDRTVAEITLTPAGGYDVGGAAFATLARRGLIRLAVALH